MHTFAVENQYKILYMAKSEKRERFEKVASKRVQRVLDTLELIQNCANRNNYEYDQSDVDRMFSEISKALSRPGAMRARRGMLAAPAIVGGCI